MCNPIASTSLAFPIDPRFIAFYEIYVRMTNVSWRHSNVISSGDKSAYAAVDARVKKLYIPFLKLLNSIDTIVGANWSVIVPENIRRVILIDLCKRFIEYIEGEHALTYQKFISDFIEDPIVRTELFESNQVYGPVILLDEYARDFIRNPDYGYGLFANMLIEHILLPVIFTFVGWTAEKSIDIAKRVPGFINANTYIQADEQSHVEFAMLIFKTFPEMIPPVGTTVTINGLPMKADGQEMISRFVAFVDALLDDVFTDVNVSGISAAILKNVARSQANDLIMMYFNGVSMYDTVPLPGYMLSTNRMKKESFFEVSGAAIYSHGEVTEWSNVSKDVNDI